MKTLVNSLLACCFALLSLSSAAQDKVQQEIKKRATGLFEEGKHLEALADFRQLLSNAPDDAELNFYYGACLLSSDVDSEEAVKHLSFASKKKTTDVRVFYFLGQALHSDYRFSEAEKMYMQFMETADPKVLVKFPECDRLVSMAQNGKQLLSNVKDIKVISKTESTTADFFRNYDLKNVGGTIITVPDELLSPEDKKRGHRPLMHYDQSKPTCYFSSYGKGGDLNIYSAVRGSNGSFSKPVIVAGDVNTTFDEDYPFMHSDGRTLYFSSKGHNSMGGFDIFASKLDPGTGLFNRAENLDFAISSAEDDIFYVVDNEKLWANFASNRNSEQGRLHVYQVKVSDSPLELALVSGKVKNEVGGLSAARIKVVDAKTEEVLGNYKTDTNGDYLVDLPGMGKYKFYVEVTGSDLTHVGTVDVPSFGEIRAFKQEMSLVEVSGQEKLLITNHFDEKVEGDVLAMAQDILKRKADLDVNANATDLLAVQDNTRTVLTDEELLVRSGFRKDVGMESVMTLAYEQSEQIQKSIKAEESERAMSAALADIESALAKDLAEQATATYKQYKSATDPAVREELLVKAASFRTTSEVHNRKAEEALYLVNQLDESIGNKTATLFELNSRNEQFEAKMLAGDNDGVIALMTEIKEADDKGVARIDVLDMAAENAQNERKESDRTLKRVEEIQDARDRTYSSLSTKKNLLEKTKKTKDQEILKAEIQSLEAELADYNSQLDKVALRLSGNQAKADISSGALTLLERMRVGEDEELAGLPPLERNQVDIPALKAKVLAASEENNQIDIARDELTMILQKRPDLASSYARPELLASYKIDDSRISARGAVSSDSDALAENTPVDFKKADQMALVTALDPTFNAKKNSLNLSDSGSVTDWETALELNRGLENRLKTELKKLSDDPAQRNSSKKASLDDLYLALNAESEELSRRIAEAGGAASNNNTLAAENSYNEQESFSGAQSSGEFNLTLQGMDKVAVEEWMRNAAIADIEEISKSNAKLLEQGEPESLKTSPGLASRMEKHSNYIQMVNTLKASKQRSMANNPASAASIKKEIAAMDKVIALKTEVMNRELLEWERLSEISLNESERQMAIRNPQYLRERELLKGNNFSPEEQLAQIKRLNASQGNSNELAAINPIVGSNASQESERNAAGRVTVNPQQAKILAELEVIKTNVADVYPLESFIIDSKWTDELIKDPEALAEAANSTPLIDEYMAEKNSMTNLEKRYTQNVISMTLAAPNSKEFRAREARLGEVNSQSAELAMRAKELFKTADVLRSNATTETDLALVNAQLREALFLELKALDLMNQAELYEKHLVEGKAPALFTYQDAIVWTRPSKETLDEMSLESESLALDNADESQPDEALVNANISSRKEVLAGSRTTSNEDESPDVVASNPKNNDDTDRSISEDTEKEIVLVPETVINSTQSNEVSAELPETAISQDGSTENEIALNTETTPTPDRTGLNNADTQVQKTVNEPNPKAENITLPVETIQIGSEQIQSGNTDVIPAKETLLAEEMNSKELTQAETTAEIVQERSKEEVTVNGGSVEESAATGFSKGDVNIAETGSSDVIDSTSLVEEDQIITEIKTADDLNELPVLTSTLALNTFPRTAAELRKQNITEPAPINISSPTVQALAEVTIAPDLAEKLSSTQLEEMKQNRVISLSAERQEQALSAQKVIYQQALQTRRLRMAEVLDIQPESRTEAQQVELQKLATESQVLQAYISTSTDDLTRLSQQRSDLARQEEALIVALVEQELQQPEGDLALIPSEETKSPTSNNTGVNPSESVKDSDTSSDLGTGDVAQALSTSDSEISTPAEIAESNKSVTNGQEVIDTRFNGAASESETSQSNVINQTLVSDLSNTSLASDSDTDSSSISPSSSTLNDTAANELTNTSVAPDTNESTAASSGTLTGSSVAISNPEPRDSNFQTPAERAATSVPVKASSSLAPDWKMPKVLKENVFDLAMQPNVAVSEAPLAPAPVATLPAGLVYQVQVGAFRNTIPSDQFAEFRPVMTEGLNSGITRYTVGLFTTENVAVSARDQVRALGYQDAFVVAYRDGKRVSLAEARRGERETIVEPSLAFNSSIPNTGNDATTLTENQRAEGNQGEASVSSSSLSDSPSNKSAGTASLGNGNGQESVTGTVSQAGNVDIANQRPTETALPSASTASAENTATALNQGTTAQPGAAGVGTEVTRKEELSDAEKESASAYYNLVKDAAPANQVEVINGLFYTVQVGVYSKPVTSSAIFNLAPLNSELMENGQIKYTSGIFDSPDVAGQWRNQVIQKGVGDAFVTAYFNGERITIANAQKLFDEGGPSVTVDFDDFSELVRDREGQAVWEMVSTSELFGSEVKENVIFKIRMGPYLERIPDKDVRVILDFEDNVEYGRKEDDTIIYTTKGAMTYEEAQEWRKTFLERGITNANIIAFKDGIEIPVKQALDFLLK